MTQIKILVNNIHDVTHRAAAETELNVYLKIGWKLQETHQHTDADSGSFMLTTILTKANDDTEKTDDRKQETKQSEDKDPVLKTDQKNTVKEVKEEKEKTKDEEEATVTLKTSTDESRPKDERLETPKGFKIEEKKDDSESSEQEEGSSKDSAAKTGTNEAEESESDEIEKFNPEEKTSEKE